MVASSSPPTIPTADAVKPALPRLPRHRFYAIAAEACVDLRVVQRYFGCAPRRKDRPNATNPQKIASTSKERIERALRTLGLEKYLHEPPKA